MARHEGIIYERKMGIGELTELLSIYDYYCQYYQFENEHEKLLWAHIMDMRLKLNKLMGKICKTIQFGISLSEAAAFYQLWNTEDTSSWPLANVIICEMIKRIDKAGHFPAKDIKKAYQIK